MKKIKYSCLSGIVFIVVNIILKLLVYGNDTIWLNYMPPLPDDILPPGSEIFRCTIQKIIPFVIINICAIVIYTITMYIKKIYNKKTDVIFSFIILMIVLIVMYFLINTQYSVCF